MTRYDNDRAAMKKKWRKLYELADAAAMLYDEEQRAKKGKSNIISGAVEDERIRFFDHVPRKIRSSLRYPQQNYANLNGASTSSSLLHLRCFEPLDYNTVTKSPKSKSSHQSSCLTEYTSRKRRAVMPLRKSSNGKFKKAKVASLPRRARVTPEWLVEVMRGMNRAQDARLIFERILSSSDVKSGQSRLLIPFNMLTRNDFLMPAESRAIEKEVVVNKEDEENIGVGTILVNQRSIKWGLRFKIWVMEKKNSGNGTLNYALNWGWNDVIKCNGLRAGDEISLWTFRCRGVLCFTLEHRVAPPLAF